MHRSGFHGFGVLHSGGGDLVSVHVGGRGPGHADRARSKAPLGYYVDSVSGLDANNGKTLATAKQTLTAVSALLASGSSVALVSGSAWREAFKPTALMIAAGGTGGLPIIRGDDIVTSWTPHSTLTDVWEHAGFTHNATGDDRITVYWNDVLLTRVTTAALCSTTPLSFVDYHGSTSPITLQINVGNGINPTNGTVEATSRDIAVQLGNGSTLDHVQVQRAMNNNGPVDFVNRTNCTARNVLARDGTKHNLGFGSGVVRDCIAYANDPPTSYEVSNTFFVSYLDVPTGQSFLYERAGAIQPAGHGDGGVAFEGHSATVGLYFDAGTLRQCWAVGRMFCGFSGGGTVGQEIGCYWNGLSVVSIEQPYTVRYSLGNIAYAVDGANSAVNTVSAQTFDQCAYYFGERRSHANNNELFRLTGAAAQAGVFTNSAIVVGGPTDYNTFIFNNGTATAGTATFNKMVLYGAGGDLIQIPNGVTYVGDYNVFGFNNTFVQTRGFSATWHGTNYTTLALWQAATGQDAHSCYVLPGDQVAAGANAFWLAYALASGGTNLTTIGPAVGDFRINPSARVYNAAGTAFIGTFPDGTAITQAGPQNHWDWNARAVASGPPTKFPTVPQTLADSQSYCTNPNAWPF